MLFELTVILCTVTGGKCGPVTPPPPFPTMHDCLSAAVNTQAMTLWLNETIGVTAKEFSCKGIDDKRLKIPDWYRKE